MTFFAALPKPFIVAVCVAGSAETTIDCVRQSVCAGADVVEVNLAQLADSDIARLHIPEELPYYVVCRRREFMAAYGLEWTTLTERADDVRMRLSSSMIDKGARAIDIECDTFDSSSPEIPPALPADLRELSVREQSVQAQKEVIHSCRTRNAEVILSCHSGLSLTTAETLALAQIMAGRGADVIKIVNRHADLESGAEALKAIVGMRRLFQCPFLMTSIGPLSSLVRLAGCYAGNSYTFCRAEGPSAYYPEHPTIEKVRHLWKLFPVGLVQN
jgi:3-dehydroquinate dehydratase